MKQETKIWWDKANRDFEVAKKLFDGGDYTYCSFWCQQAAEKALKAMLLEKTGILIPTHDLVLLSKKLGAAAHIIDLCKELSPVYMESRYPDVEEFREYTKEESETDLKNSKEILQWVEKNI